MEWMERDAEEMGQVGHNRGDRSNCCDCSCNCDFYEDIKAVMRAVKKETTIGIKMLKTIKRRAFRTERVFQR